MEPIDSSPSYESPSLRRAIPPVAGWPVTFSFSLFFFCRFTAVLWSLSTPPSTHDAPPDIARPQGARRSSARPATGPHNSPKSYGRRSKAQQPSQCQESIDNGRHETNCDVRLHTVGDSPLNHGGLTLSVQQRGTAETQPVIQCCDERPKPCSAPRQPAEERHGRVVRPTPQCPGRGQWRV